MAPKKESPNTCWDWPIDGFVALEGLGRVIIWGLTDLAKEFQMLDWGDYMHRHWSWWYA